MEFVASEPYISVCSDGIREPCIICFSLSVYVREIFTYRDYERL